MSVTARHAKTSMGYRPSCSIVAGTEVQSRSGREGWHYVIEIQRLWAYAIYARKPSCSSASHANGMKVPFWASLRVVQLLSQTALCAAVLQRLLDMPQNRKSSGAAPAASCTAGTRCVGRPISSKAPVQQCFQSSYISCNSIYVFF